MEETYFSLRHIFITFQVLLLFKCIAWQTRCIDTLQLQPFWLLFRLWGLSRKEFYKTIKLLAPEKYIISSYSPQQHDKILQIVSFWELRIQIPNNSELFVFIKQTEFYHRVLQLEELVNGEFSTSIRHSHHDCLQIMFTILQTGLKAQPWQHDWE